jgi:4-amino-4-deoxychorismate mutase
VSGDLDDMRRRLDRIDDEIALLLGERLEICRMVARYKSERGIPMMQPERVKAVQKRYLRRGSEHDLPEDFTARLFELLIETTCRVEDELMEELAKQAAGTAPGDGSKAAPKRRAVAKGSS